MAGPAEQIDRLGLLTLLSGLYFFQVWSIKSIFASGIWSLLIPALVGISVLSVIIPRLHGLLALNTFFWVAFYVDHTPISSNNQLTSFAFSIVVLGAYLTAFVISTGDNRRDSLFQTIAGPGRYILAAMYFFGIYHKINSDFLDPEVSCAVVLYVPLADTFGLANWKFGHYSAIYATFVIEGIAMIALFVPKWKKWGLMLGLPFHIVIGWTGYAYYKDFSTIVLVLYLLFIPRIAFEAAWQRATALFGPERAAPIGRGVLITAVFGYYLSLYLREGSILAHLSHSGFVWAFSVYALLFYAFAVVFVPRPAYFECESRVAYSGWLIIIPLAYFLNGWSPYLGLKTESSVAMFSNLHTEGGQTNHLIHGVLPFGWDYQEDLVYMLNSDGTPDRSYALVRYSFDKLLSAQPNHNPVIYHDNVEKIVDETWRNTYLESSAFMRWFLIFKPVDFDRPKICTH